VTDSANWHAAIRVHRPTTQATDRVAQALAPEVSREVPRSRAEIVRVDPTSLELRISAADTSACRAALNTYLSWVGLILSTEGHAFGALGFLDVAR
jgi:tRNA threonylcarbamoyladenosine modification (KEOPS) complex  Pcc1 subunit